MKGFQNDHKEILKCKSRASFGVILLYSATINHSDTAITTSECLSCFSVLYNFSDSLGFMSVCMKRLVAQSCSLHWKNDYPHPQIHPV